MRVLLVDGTNVVMRYAHAMLPDVVSGSARGATDDEVLKVLAAVERAIREAAAATRSTHAIIATDSAVDPWRKQVYPEYKAHRKGITSIWSNRLFLYLSPRGWLCLRHPGEEADDVIATLATRLAAARKYAAVLSGDSDLLALASETTQCYQFGKPPLEPRFIERAPSYVVAKFGVAPERLHLYKALVGEPGDNLPGVYRVGDKKARKLLDLVIYDERGQGVDSLRRLLANHSMTAVAEFDLALKLATLNANVPLDPIQPARCAIPEE